MNLIALLIALALEKGLSRTLSWREPRVMYGYAQASCRAAEGAGPLRMVVAIIAALLPALAVAAIALVFGYRLAGLLWVAYGAVILFFALGPRDLEQEIHDYCEQSQAATREAPGEAARVASEILANDARQRRGPELESVADAAFVQANNRLFGVLFWFVLLPPAGAVLFRVTDLLRRAAIERAAQQPDEHREATASVMCQLHGILAWLPARLLALTYGVAGSFDDAFAGWRNYLAAERDSFFEANDLLLVHAGRGALVSAAAATSSEPERAQRAWRLIHRSFWIWLTVICVLTISAYLA
jgi:membrane protein required for beta-lactamase induction